MEDFDEPFDLDGDGKFGAFEASILEEETNRKKGDNGNSGCCIVFLALGSSMLLSIWGITKFLA